MLYLIAAAAVLGILFETTVFHVAPIGNVVPDLMLILCVYVGLHRHTIGGSLSAFFLGYFNDAFAGAEIGLHAFALSFVFLVVYTISRKVWTDNVVANVAIVFFAAIVKGFVVGLLLGTATGAEQAWGEMLSPLWKDAIVASLFSPLVFVALDGGRRAWGLD